MSTLLISGSSYDEVYSELHTELKDIFKVNDVVNLSISGASPQRQIRVAIEWIAQNGNPEICILPVSHHNRFDLPIAKNFDKLNNLHYKASWIQQYNQEVYEKEINKMVDRDTLNTFLKTGALVHKVEHTIHDELFVKILTFQSFLAQRKIKHLIYDAGNCYKPLWWDYLCINDDNSGYQPGMRKRELIQNNPGIYKFFDFCSNVWMYDTMQEEKKKTLKEYFQPVKYPLSGSNDDMARKATLHHDKHDTLRLVKHLLDNKAMYENFD